MRLLKMYAIQLLYLFIANSRILQITTLLVPHKPENIIIASTGNLKPPSNEIQCITCKYFIKDLWTENKFGKCARYPYTPTTNNYVVGMGEAKKKEYNYCLTARTNEKMCGKKGKNYTKK